MSRSKQSFDKFLFTFWFVMRWKSSKTLKVKKFCNPRRSLIRSFRVRRIWKLSFFFLEFLRQKWQIFDCWFLARKFKLTSRNFKYRVSQQVLDLIFAKNLSRLQRTKNSWKFVYILAKQCRSPFSLTRFLIKNSGF